MMNQDHVLRASQDDEMESLVLHDDADNGADNSSGNVQQPPQSPKSPFNSFLDPPSYAEAIFTSFDTNGHDQTLENSNQAGSGSGTESDSIQISVSDPQEEQEVTNSLVPGGSSYHTYLITTRTEKSEFGVRRRFREVVTLSERLSEVYRGYVIPVRPEKSSVERKVMQKEEFVEQRRLALEKYLRKLGLHPVIGKSEELRVFLQVQGKLPLMRTTDVASRMLDGAVRLPRQLFGAESGVVDLNDVAQPAKSGRDLLRIFKELKQSVSNDWGGAKPLVVEEDKEFMEKKDKLMEFEQQLSNVSQQAESLVKFQQDMGETMGELGLAFVKLTKFETEEAEFESQRVRAADMKNVATAAVKASRLYRELNTQTIKHLDKLHEYLGTMLAINNAFADRSSALLTVQTLSSELASLHSRIEKLEVASSRIFGGDKSRMRKIEELKEAVRVTESAKICADREYERIKENNRSELERIDKERQSDFQNMLRGFVVNQAGYAEKMAAVWEKLAEETSTYSSDSS